MLTYEEFAETAMFEAGLYVQSPEQSLEQIEQLFQTGEISLTEASQMMQDLHH